MTHASRNVVEDYTGMLPPYTLWRKIVYRLSQLALTESIFTFTKRKKQPATAGMMKMTNDKGKYSQYLTVAGSYFANKGWVHLLLAGGLYILYKMFFRTSLPFFLTISSLPLMTAIFLLIIKYSKQSFYTLFTLQFLLAAALCSDRHTLGVATLMCTLFVVVLLFAYGMHEKIDWSESRNGMLMLFLIWGVYCILEIANPNNVQQHGISPSPIISYILLYVLSSYR